MNLPIQGGDESPHSISEDPAVERRLSERSASPLLGYRIKPRLLGQLADGFIDLFLRFLIGLEFFRIAGLE